MRDSKVRARAASAGVAVVGLAVGLMSAWTLQAGPPKESKPAPVHAPVGGGHAAGGGAPARPGGGSAISTSRPGAVSTGGAGGAGGVSTARPGGSPAAVSTARPGGPAAAGGAAARPSTASGRAGAAPGGAGMAGRAAGAGAARPGGASFGGHAAPGGHQEFARNGSGIQRRADGKIADVHDTQRGMDVHHGLDGSTRSVHELPGGGRIVAGRGGAGYVQRRYAFQGHDFGHRTYFAHGRAYDRFYGRYDYRGHFFDVYVRAHYYPYGFYYYAYNPWATPVVYVGPAFVVAPAYAYYYEPYPTYAGPEYYVTDEVVAASLVAAYDAQQQQGVGDLLIPAQEHPLLALSRELLDALFTPAYAAGGATALSKQVKDQVAGEIQGVLQQAAGEAQANAAGKPVDPTAGNIVSLFRDGKPHVLLVGASVDAVSSSGMECALTAGDVLRVSGVGGESADVHVLAAKNGGKECPFGGTVSIAVSDLQDMYNFMRESVDDGLQDLQKKAGTGGLPATPAKAAGGLSNAPFANGAPPPEADARKLIAAQVTEADAAEKEVAAGVAADAGSAAPAGAAPAVGSGGIQAGQTIDEVVAQLGQPSRIIDLGLKKTYIYPDQRIVFISGAVSEVK